MSPCYPSDIVREPFNKIKPLLECARKKTRPMTWMGCRATPQEGKKKGAC